VLLAAGLLCGAGGRPESRPIGPGPEFQPAARWPLAGGAAFGGLRTDLQAGARVHLELFARRLVVVVPGGIGVSGGRTELYGRVVDALWHAPAWTTIAGGVVHFDGRLRLADVFAVWGEPLGRHRLLRFSGPVTAFVNGRRRAGDPRTITLRDGDQIVLEVGGYVPPHDRFTFPRPLRPYPLGVTPS
jgi:hypothetical protein